jgi:hypothetical protein
MTNEKKEDQPDPAVRKARRQLHTPKPRWQQLNADSAEQTTYTHRISARQLP